jgi:hypothetical protein
VKLLSKKEITYTMISVYDGITVKRYETNGYDWYEVTRDGNVKVLSDLLLNNLEELIQKDPE